VCVSVHVHDIVRFVVGAGAAGAVLPTAAPVAVLLRDVREIMKGS